MSVLRGAGGGGWSGGGDLKKDNNADKNFDVVVVVVVALTYQTIGGRPKEFHSNNISFEFYFFI